jgi:putative tricarboxylic transport membrane protein
LSGETQILSTGFGEALELMKAGQVRILAVTSEEPVSEAPEIPTLKQLGYDTTFANWRGFFGAPGLPEEKAQAFAELFAKMYDMPEWETVRARNGWINLYKPLDEFYAFLEQQEKEIGDLMRTLGFLE